MKPGRNDCCWCGSGKKYKHCHMEMDERLAELKAEGYLVPRRKLLKTEEQIAKIRASAAVNTALLDHVAAHVQEGMTTEEIDRLVYEFTIAHGAVPAPLHFQGFPKSVCTSINNVVCHGIPSEKEVLRDGDILNVDVSTNLDGYYSDASRMFMIGEVSQEAKALVQTAQESIQVGLDALKPWGLLGDMGHAIHVFIEKKGYSVVRDIGGHGIGLEFHEDPYVSYVSAEGTGMVLVPGLMFTIEPMINQGRSEILIDERDGWTVRTADGKLSAQWESMVLMTEDGPEVLTR
ncbi:MAG: methionyl aminopeptidase [Clostridia bacterium]|uniref:Methionine aminopeptidase n=1 Tax=Bianquea renquensis TaxID=2763661 RepID=A0A926DP10_9FIRM|nr:methionyl aminopeptidase [Bianquea renquensis]MBC8542528.1 methionyl aminopeptidase [Bianquea renquensis]